MSNVASETLETKQKIGAQTRPNGAAAAATAAAAGTASPAAATGAASLQNVPFATPKHHGAEGRTSPRSAPKKVSNVASETLETEQKIGAQIRPNGAAAAIAAAAATAAAAAGAASPAAATGAAGLQNVPFATPKHHGPEGRTSPRSCTQKVSNVASETLETEQKIGTQTRPNGAAAAATAAAAGAASPAAATGAASLQNVPFATPKHHGPEGRTSPRS